MHADRDKEDVEIEWEERNSSCQIDPNEEIENGMEDHEGELFCSLERQRKELENDKEDYEEGEVDLEA